MSLLATMQRGAVDFGLQLQNFQFLIPYSLGLGASDRALFLGRQEVMVKMSCLLFLEKHEQT